LEPVARCALRRSDVVVRHFSRDLTPQTRCVLVAARSSDVEPLVRADIVGRNLAARRIQNAELVEHVGVGTVERRNVDAGKFDRSHNLASPGLLEVWHGSNPSVPALAPKISVERRDIGSENLKGSLSNAMNRM